MNDIETPETDPDALARAEDLRARIEAIRKMGQDLSQAIRMLCPSGVERDEAMRGVDDSMMRAVVAIAVNPNAPFEAQNGPAQADDVADDDDFLSDPLQASRCTCPPGPEEDSILPSAECREHGAFVTSEQVHGVGPGVEELERQANAALTKREFAVQGENV